jgi:hypothetical protein
MTDVAIPETFTFSKRAPSKKEILQLHKWLSENCKGKRKSILEFGCGITSWALSDSVEPEMHVCFEQFKPCINTVKQHLPKIQIIESDWSGIPKHPYDLILVDSSTGAPKGIKTIDGNPFRDDAIKYVEEFCAKDRIIIVHDWNHRQASWRRPRRYLEKNGYTLLHKIDQYGHGFGIYQTIKS